MLLLYPSNYAFLLIGFGFLGRKLHANAEASEELVDPPKVEEKLGAVPNGLSTDSDVAKRCVNFFSVLSLPHQGHT